MRQESLSFFSLETLKFISLASGSSGNCYYLGTGTDGLLIDAGIGIRRLRQRLKTFGIAPEGLRAVLVTHDHIDHIKAVGCMSRLCNIPVYATAAVHTGMANCRFMESVPPEAQKIIEKESPFILNGNTDGVRSFIVTAFEVPHDSSDNVGYYIQYGRHRITFATDVGHLTPTVRQYLCMAEHIVLEANYDEALLQSGPYPSFLKERVKGPNGHLSNREAAEFLSEHCQRMKHIWLCHLSETNNRPDVALQTVTEYLQSKKICVGKDVSLTALKYASPSPLFEFTD